MASPRSRQLQRRRRGVEIIEFAMIFPVFLFLFFGIMEYSWYFFQRGAVIEASRLGCQAASQQDPNQDSDGVAGLDFVKIARDVINAELGRQAGIRCDEADVHCDITITDLSGLGNEPPRIVCVTSVNFRSLTGFLGSDTDPGGSASQLAHNRWGTETGIRMLPEFLVGRSVAVFEGAP